MSSRQTLRWFQEASCIEHSTLVPPVGLNTFTVLIPHNVRRKSRKSGLRERLRASLQLLHFFSTNLIHVCNTCLFQQRSSRVNSSGKYLSKILRYFSVLFHFCFHYLLLIFQLHYKSFANIILFAQFLSLLSCHIYFSITQIYQHIHYII